MSVCTCMRNRLVGMDFLKLRCRQSTAKFIVFLCNLVPFLRTCVIMCSSKGT